MKMGQLLSATLFGACTLGFLALTSVATAQSQESGGLRITFGIEQGLLLRDNPSLAIPSTGVDTSGRTSLRFGILSETRSQRLAFDMKGAVATGSKTEDGLVSPAATLSYQLGSAAALLQLDGFIREADVDTLTFTSVIPALGAPVITAVRGTGTRLQTGATAAMEFGRSSLFGGSLSLGRTDTVYSGTADPNLIDNVLLTAGAAARFDLTKVSTATIGVTASRLEEDGRQATDSETLTLDYTHLSQNGAYLANLTATRLDDGTRHALLFGRTVDLSTGQLSFAFGVNTLLNGSPEGVGRLDWQQDFAAGALRLGLLRQIVGSDRADETRIARLTMNYEQQLTSLIGLNLTVGLQDSRETMTGQNTLATDLSASLRRDLLQDWGLNLGATHRVKNDDRVGRIDSTGIFITLSREFEFRP